jgi:hypothetical protein
MKIKHLLFILLLVFISRGALAQDFGITYVDQPYESIPSDTNLELSPSHPLQLNNITDTLYDQVVGHFTSHQVGFQLPSYDFYPAGCLAGRQVVMTFPPEFDVKTITSVRYRDTDNSTADPKISWVYVYSHTVVIRFYSTIPGPRSSQFAYITLSSIKNPTVARDFRVVVEIDNTSRKTVVGPNFSAPFYTLPDAPHAIAIHPDSDLTLTAGDGVQFFANVVDQYANIIPDMPLSWALDPRLDTIGTIYGPFLQTSYAGQGRVLVNSGDLSAVSGLISVLPAAPSGIIISDDPDTTEAGFALHKDITTTIVDRFGNRVNGYRGTVWFVSDDPNAEITHNEANPYQFTAADQGRKVFPGAEFVFHRSGQRTLTARTPAFEASTSNIFILPAGIAGFDVAYPVVHAGVPFTLLIHNAVDSFGNRFNGVFPVSGGKTASDGTTPILTQVVVVDGEGSAQEVLVATGANDLEIGYGLGQSRLVTIPVLPGALASLDLQIDKTQFIGHHFLGTATVTALDRFRNIKTDYATTGSTLAVSTDSGTITPSVVDPVQFVDGIADISGSRYDGNPGSVIVKVSLDQQGNSIESSAAIFANGIEAEIAPAADVAPQIPHSWDFRISGWATNPGNMTPLQVMYSSGFVPAEKARMAQFADACVPQPFNGSTCKFVIDRNADVPAGAYTFSIAIEAMYVFGNDTVITHWTHDRSTRVLPFVDFTFDTEQLPHTAFAATYAVIAPLSIGNTNAYSMVGMLAVDVGLRNDSLNFNLGEAREDTYTWPVTIALPMTYFFSEKMAARTYFYDISINLLGITESGQNFRFSKRYELPQTITLLAPDAFVLDTISFRPTAVAANSSVPFHFDFMVNGTSPVALDGVNSVLTFSSGSVTSSARLSTDVVMLNSGTNHITTAPLFIPSSWKGNPISGRLQLKGVEGDVLPIDIDLTFGAKITVTSALSLQIVSLTNDALNSPRVNTRQPFAVSSKIANLSALTIEGPITIQLASDGGSILPPPVVVDSIPANDTIKVAFQIVADSLPKAVELFSLHFIGEIPNVNVLPPADNEATAIVQLPARINLEGEIVSPLGPGPILGYGDKFKVEARSTNLGQSDIQGGTIALDYANAADFGVVFPINASLDTLVAWDLTAPQRDLNGSFTIRWINAPIDRNTGRPVDSISGSITVPFTVQRSETKLVMQADQFTTKPLQRGVPSTLCRLSLENVTNDNRAAVQVSSIAIELTDRNGQRIAGDSLVAADGSNFYINDQPVATFSIVDGLLTYRFAGTIISPGEIKNLELHLTPRQNTNLDYFNMRVTGDRVIAWIAQQAQTPVPVTGLLDRPFEVNIPKGIIAEDLAASFKNYPNPFNPDAEHTEFRYFLSTASDVDIYIFTVTGEEVRHLHYNAGVNGGQAGPNVDIFWDGKNENGDVVLNGAYLALIKVADGGRMAKVKVAVVK